ncbi:DUF397 domain-containing protein [Streptomyces sp. NPDC060035]|uniref:DUF397 domain-containing protein n=1 Tax=Streptomyces sp. NPDC060035 TaxID=3347044 RepID=UPI0036987F3C
MPRERAPHDLAGVPLPHTPPAGGRVHEQQPAPRLPVGPLHRRHPAPAVVHLHEVAAHPSAIHVRDSRTPEGPTFTVAPTTWSAFAAFAARG